jgi:ribosomal-protein-alanine N-acetyltransferase
MAAYRQAPDGRLNFMVEPMLLEDVPAVLAVERASFSSPWPARAYRYEITRNDRSHYFVLRCVKEPSDGSNGLQPAEQPESRRWLEFLPRLRHAPEGETTGAELAGYGGLWISGYRGHISTLAVGPQWRHRGLGLFLLLHMIDCAASLHAKHVTLEVRASNHVAQSLYRKCGFAPAGLEKGYYRDNGEDALLMRTPSLKDAAYQAHLTSLWEELECRLDHRIPREGC